MCMSVICLVFSSRVHMLCVCVCVCVVCVCLCVYVCVRVCADTVRVHGCERKREPEGSSASMPKP
jgi:hypothetical protein